MICIRTFYLYPFPSLPPSLPPSLDHFRSVRARPQYSEFYGANELIKKLSSIALVLAVDHWVVLRPNCEYSTVQGLWVDTLEIVVEKTNAVPINQGSPRCSPGVGRNMVLAFPGHELASAGLDQSIVFLLLKYVYW